MPQTNVALELDAVIDITSPSEVEVSEQLINEYKKLNEKMDQTITRIHNKRQKSLKK